VIINKGQHLTFAQGAYSDYCVDGLVVAVDDFSLDDMQREWESHHTTEETINSFKNSTERKVTGTAFLPWLVSKGLVEDVHYIEVHTGSYGASIISICSNGDNK